MQFKPYSLIKLSCALWLGISVAVEPGGGAILANTNLKQGSRPPASGPKDRVSMSILYSGSRAQDTGIPEIMVCRILMPM